MSQEALMRPLSEGRFRFACHKTLPCFTKCCANLNLILTPYDVIRLKNRLGLASGVFLEKYTTASVDDAYGVPVVKLKMNSDALRRCPFVTPKGCSVYEDRPGACRIYPLGRAALKAREGFKAGEYYFTVKESHCLGFNEDREWTIHEWIADQNLDEYNAMNDFFMDITAGKQAKIIKALGDRKLRMFYMAFYSLDDFRRFVFNTTLLDKFDIPQDVLARIKKDDIELMKFACRWLRFALFGEKTMAVDTIADGQRDCPVTR